MKTCQRCFVKFNCQSESIEQCDCSKISLSRDTFLFLQKTNYDCLCNDCLLEVTKMVNEYKNEPFPTNSQNLKEGEHYYFNEQGLFVMTEVYHYLRGFCCGNGCKHCAYGNKIV